MPPSPQPAACAPPETKSPRLGSIYEHYQPFPRQQQFHDCRAKYRLFGGAAGPGKTKALLWEAIRIANQYDGCDTLLLRRTFPELESSLVAYFRRDVPRHFYRAYNDAKHLVTWLNGSTTRFGHCAHENDVHQYQGAEYVFIGLDELTHFTLKQWQFLTSRNRCPIPGAFANMAGATNPGNIGHAWVKALWIDKRPPAGMENPAAYDPADYAFIRATVADNPIYAGDFEYRRTLDALPTHLRRAFLQGDWDVFAGQYFDVLDFSRHVVTLSAFPVPQHLGQAPLSVRCHPEGVRQWRTTEGPVAARAAKFNSVLACHTDPSAILIGCPQDDNASLGSPSSFALQPWLPRWISIDWGFEHPSAVLWHAAAPPSDENPAGLIITYREFVQNHLSPRMLAAAIAERTRGEKISAIYLSPDAFAQRTAEDTIAQQLGHGLRMEGLPLPDPADDERVGGWMLMYELLREDAWLITGDCPKLLESLPTLTRDPENVEDILKCDGDDVADSARYGIKSRLDSRASPLVGVAAEVSRRAERITAADPTSRAIWMRKSELDARRAARSNVSIPRRWRI